MNTVIVPVDFSTTSLHTARYAAELLVGHYGVTMILYHSYSKESEATTARESLEALMNELKDKYVLAIDLLAHHQNDFVEGLEQAVRHRKADLVIMGITGKSAIAQVLFGSNTLKMVETKVCPVLIVPAKAPFKKMRNVMLTSDFKHTLKTTPSAPIKDFLGAFNPKLHIVNVDKNHYISLTTEYQRETQDLAEMFEAYNPEFYFLRLYDITDAITLFAQDKAIDLIIIIRRNDSFMDKLFKASRTKSLSYHTEIPMLVMHE